MASGRPIVAVDIPGIEELIEHNNNGIVVKPRSPDSLAFGISRFIDDNDLRDKIGQKKVHNLLLEGKFSELFEKIYESSIINIEGIDEYEKHGMLAESFTHYLFTEMLIPSQRKILFENTEYYF